MTNATRSLILSFFVVAALLVAALPAAAKGPVGAEILPPDGGAPVDFGGPGGGGLPAEPGDGSALGELVDASGLFPAAFEQTPNPMLVASPAETLGPRYVVTWDLGFEMAGARIEQWLYPLAKPRPVSYTPPDQVIEPGFSTSPGGWFVAGPRMAAALEDLGFDLAPALVRAGPERGAQPLAAQALWPVLSVVGLLAMVFAAAALVRRRPIAAEV